MSKRSDYAPSKGHKDCPPHQLRLTSDPRSHTWTDNEGNNWACKGLDALKKGE